MPNQMRPIHPGEILKGEMEELGRVDEFEVFPTKSVGYRKTYFSLNASKNNWLLLIRQHALGLSARQLAMALGVPTNRVTSIVHEARALTADTALRLARYFGTSPEFWLNLQSAYELRRAQQERGARIAQEVVPRT